MKNEVQLLLLPLSSPLTFHPSLLYATEKIRILIEFVKHTCRFCEEAIEGVHPSKCSVQYCNQ
jgi:hypothetical protein